MWDTPFDESMLDDPRGVIVLCTCRDDAIELGKILDAHGIDDIGHPLEKKYDTCLEDVPDQAVCFNILDERLVEDGAAPGVSVQFCFRSFYEKAMFNSRIRCTFLPGGNLPDLDVDGVHTDILLA